MWPQVRSSQTQDLNDARGNARNQKCKLVRRRRARSVISSSVIHLTQALAQCAANCTLRSMLRDASQFQAKQALSEVRSCFGKRSDSGVAQKFPARPRDLWVAKAARGQEPGPKLRLLMFEPFDVGRQRIAHAQVAKNIVSRCVHD